MQSEPEVVGLLEAFSEKHKLPASFNDTALQWYIPFVEKLTLHHRGAKRPLFVGLNGCQGSGKSTLSDFIAAYLTQINQLSVAVLSLDDFYYSQQKRQELAQLVHPLLQTRGVPGTHDCELMRSVLNSLKLGEAVHIPRFNKAIDNPYPIEQWPHISAQMDVIIVEGWCWGAPAQNNEELSQAVNQLEQEQDSSGAWREYVNQALRNEYEPLYKQMNYWLMLKAPSFDCVYQWRLEQEEKLRQSITSEQDASAVMTPEQVLSFIQHYQRLTEHGLAHIPEKCDCIFSLNDKRLIQSVDYP